MINWNNFFNHIVILSASQNVEKRHILDKEFERVGLSNYEYFINIKDNLLSENIYDYNTYKKDCLNGHYFIIKRAYELGWDSVWIMEDDIRFLKDEESIQVILNKFAIEKYKSNIYMFDWVFFKEYGENDRDYFGAASYWLNRKGMEYFIYCIEHYPFANDFWFMTLMQYNEEVQFNYHYILMSGEEKDIIVSIPKNTVLPVTFNFSDSRLCIQVDTHDNCDAVSNIYIPKCKENEIDENLYQLYSKI